jgi:hypothetical protein
MRLQAESVPNPTDRRIRAPPELIARSLITKVAVRRYNFARSCRNLTANCDDDGGSMAQKERHFVKTRPKGGAMIA